MTVVEALREAQHDPDAAVAIWTEWSDDDEPLGGLVVGITEHFVLIECPSCSTFVPIPLAGITEVEIERP